MRSFLQLSTVAVSLLSTCVGGVDFTLGDEDSTKKAASTVAYGLMKYYSGNETGDVPGNLPDPYYWWEAGAMFGNLMDYWWLTGDETYNDVVIQGLTHQAGNDRDFMPTNQTRAEGNDDQGFWALTSMRAAEIKFPDPPADDAQYLALTQAVFNEFVARWSKEADEGTCKGGLRWQIFQFNNGFNYKNSISNGCFFNIAARLARYTGNDTYADWATKIFDWEQSTGLISKDYHVYDGATIEESNKCDKIDRAEWTYNSGIYLHGAAVMYNYTESAEWKDRVDGLLKVATTKFFKNKIVVEQFCEQYKLCDNDQQSFKGYLLRWLSATMQMVPYTASTISPLLDASATAAAAACNGPADGQSFKGLDGTACGFAWTTEGKYDGSVGIGSQMDALSALIYTLTEKRGVAPVTNATGGTSKGDADAGSRNSDDPHKHMKKITAGDKAGAGILTTLVALGVVAGGAFVIS